MVTTFSFTFADVLHALEGHNADACALGIAVEMAPAVSVPLERKARPRGFERGNAQGSVLVLPVVRQ